MSTFAEFLDELHGGPKAKPRPLPEAQVMVLREVFVRYEAGCTFAPGDLVTPRPGFNLKDAGEPHIVLEVRADAPYIAFDEKSGGANYGRRLDMRVGCLSGGDYVAFWVESWAYEPCPAAELSGGGSPCSAA